MEKSLLCGCILSGHSHQKPSGCSILSDPKSTLYSEIATDLHPTQQAQTIAHELAPTVGSIRYTKHRPITHTTAPERRESMPLGRNCV